MTATFLVTRLADDLAPLGPEQVYQTCRPCTVRVAVVVGSTGKPATILTATPGKADVAVAETNWLMSSAGVVLVELSTVALPSAELKAGSRRWLPKKIESSFAKDSLSVPQQQGNP